MSATDDSNDQHGGDGDMKKSSKKECISCEQNNVENITEGIDSVAIQDDVSTCANCGKEGHNDDMNTCNKCKLVKYCNGTCKKKHRKKHKKRCEEYVRLAADKHNEELRIAAELHDEELFKQPPSILGDCPICFLRIPTLGTGSKYMSCCGKTICSGCSYADVYDDQGNEVDIIKQNECAFCRVLAPITDEEMMKRIKKRAEDGDAEAIYNLGCYHNQGDYGFPQDYDKALECWHRAAELSYVKAYLNIGYFYEMGLGVEVDRKKAENYYELAAIGGNVTARFNLAIIEARAGNFKRALKHHMIAIKGGEEDSLKSIQLLYEDGYATKEDYMKALQLYQMYLAEIKSKQRDEAAAGHVEYRYY